MKRGDDYMQIIKDIFTAQREIGYNLEKGKDRDINIRKYKALKEILNFVLDMKYIEPKLRDKVLFYLGTEGKENTRINKTASQFKCTSRSVQILLEMTSSKAYEAIGKNTINLIMDGDIDTAVLNFKYNSTSKIDTSKLFIKGVERILPPADKGENINVNDCLKELIFLGMISTEKIKQELETLDKSKLSFILYLLNNNDNEYLDEKKMIIDYLTGCTSIKDVVKQLTKVNV